MTAKNDEKKAAKGEGMRRDIQEEFKEKGGASVGARDSVVDGHLDNIAGSSQRAYGADKPVRPQIGDRAKKLDR
jgi:hypothetical protein